MDDTTSLTSIIDGGNATTQPVETAPVQTQQAETTNTETQQTGEPAKAETQDAPPAPEKAKREQTEADKAFAVIKRELKDQKRRNEQLASEMQAMRTPPKPALDPLTMEPAAFEQELNARNATNEWRTRTAVFEELASEKYPDYEEIRDVFVDEFQNDAAVMKQFFAARNPAEFAYKTVKDAKARQEIGDPVQYTEKIRQEERQKVLAEMPALIQAELKKALAGVLPSSLADAQTQGGRVTNPTGFNGPTSLESILQTK